MTADRGALLLSLNIRAGGGARVAALLGYLGRHRPHTLVLTEWRDNEAGRAFTAWARRRRMHHAGIADGGTANGVFIASREPFSARSATPAADGAGVIALAEFARFRLLACYFPVGNDKAPFFARCAELASAHAGHPLLLLGDLNTGNQLADRVAEGVRYSCAEAFDGLATSGLPDDLWRRSQGAEARDYSWLSHRGNGFRIDHALANPLFTGWADPQCRYDHTPRRNGWSDHSAMLVRVDRSAIG